MILPRGKFHRADNLLKIGNGYTQIVRETEPLRLPLWGLASGVCENDGVENKARDGRVDLRRARMRLV